MQILCRSNVAKIRKLSGTSLSPFLPKPIIRRSESTLSTWRRSLRRSRYSAFAHSVSCNFLSNVASMTCSRHRASWATTAASRSPAVVSARCCSCRNANASLSSKAVSFSRISSSIRLVPSSRHRSLCRRSSELFTSHLHCQRLQSIASLHERNIFGSLLHQKFAHQSARSYSTVQICIRAWLVSSDPDKVFRLRIHRKHFPHQRCRCLMFLRCDGWHKTAHRIQHLNRWIPSLRSQGARKHHVPIQK